MNIGSSLSINARRMPNKLAIIFQDKTYTYGQFNEEVNKLAHGLLNQGVQKGNKVAFMMKNSDAFMFVYYAVMKVGAIAVPINFRLSNQEVSYILDNGDVSVVFFDGDYASLINEATWENEKVKLKIAVNGDPVEDQQSYRDVLSNHVEDPGVIVDELDDAQILYTSGTTGFPKGALFDHKRVLQVATNTSLSLKINSEDNLLHVAPLFHSAQLNLFMVSGTYLSCTQVIHETFDPRKVLQDIEKYKISYFFAVPTMYNFLLVVPNKEEYDLSSITRCSYGAAPMPTAVLEQTMKLFDTDQFYNLCGQTEGGPGAGIFLLPEEHKKKIGAAGKTPALNTEVRIVDENNNDTTPGQVGEFIIKSEMVMKRYYNKPEETKKALKNGWLYTGDLAMVDEDGFITLVDRKKDMIITGGENVYSTEVEQVLYKYPHILEAAVIGLPDPAWGERIVAVLVPKEGQTIDLEDVKAFCKKQLAGYKVPNEFIIEKTIPRNAAGKVLKYRMRESLAEVRK